MARPAIITVIIALLSATAAVAVAEEGAAIVAVFDMEISGAKLDKRTKSGLNDYLFNKMASQPGFKVVPRNQVEKRLRAEKSKSYQACYDQSCQIEIGKELAAQKTLSTKILRFGNECTISLVLYDLRTAATDSAADASGGCSASQLARSIEAAVVKLRAPGAPAQAAAAAVTMGVADEKNCPLPGTRRMGQPYPDGNSVTCIDGSGKMQGSQISWHANGQIAMKAEYRDGQLEGTYTVFHRNGATYERGANKAGRRVGTWTRYSDDGAKDEEGEYKNGAKAGTWTQWDRDGKKRSETQYDADMRAGRYVEYFPDGKTKETGEYAGDKKEGLWITYRQNGQKEEELRYRADKRHGQQIEYDSEGRKRRVIGWADGKRSGPYENWSEREGAMYLERKGTYRDGEEDGLRIFYYDDGQEWQRYTYVAGKQNGPYVSWTRSDTGHRKSEEGTYKDDKKEGRWTHYGADGLPDYEETYVAGKKNGPMTSWGISSRDGKRFKTTEGNYENDKQHGRWLRFKPDGSVSSEEVWENGKKK